MDDLRAALEWCFRPDTLRRAATADDRLVGLRLCDALGWFWYACGYHAEGRRWLDRAVEVTAENPTGDHVRGLHALAVLMLQHGENEAGRAVLEACLAYWRVADDPVKVATELNSLGVAHRNLGDTPPPARRWARRPPWPGRPVTAAGSRPRCRTWRPSRSTTVRPSWRWACSARCSTSTPSSATRGGRASTTSTSPARWSARDARTRPSTSCSATTPRGRGARRRRPHHLLRRDVLHPARAPRRRPARGDAPRGGAGDPGEGRAPAAGTRQGPARRRPRPRARA